MQPRDEWKDDTGLIYTFRGVANRELTPEIVLQIGKFVGSRWRERGEKEFLLAGDYRISTPMLKSALASGLLAAGLQVRDCGFLPSPVLAFEVRRCGIPGCIITASHNPPQWNGLEFYEPDSHLFGPPEEREIRTRLREEVPGVSWEHLGVLQAHSGVIERYVERVAEEFPLARPLRVAIDPGGGVGTLVVPHLLERLGVEFTAVNAELDPFFRQRPSEPNFEHLTALREAVWQEGARAGFAYDGDSDRLVVVDERGEHVPSDHLAWLFCKHFFPPPGPVVLNVSTSILVETALQEQGYECLECRWGQTFVGDLLRRTGAVFAVEPNGHFDFPQLALRSDGIAATAALCAILAAEERELSELLTEFPPTVILDYTVVWEQDLAERATECQQAIKTCLGQCERKHERLFVGRGYPAKIVIRQSPFDNTLRFRTEHPDRSEAERMMAVCKEALGVDNG
ncbi:MAG TPA: hypothetical protein EYP85_07295 [Armatimonadetes bacterium]|nr:hypothetical protein [Armatimonadota bacterium]